MTDKSSTVILRPAQSLTEYEVEGSADVVTRALVLTAAGWQESADASSEAEFGRWETFVQVGNTPSTADAEQTAQAMFAVNGGPDVRVTAAHTTVAGPQPYVDYDWGDVISTVDEWGDPATAEVVSISESMDSQTGQVVVTPELRLL